MEVIEIVDNGTGRVLFTLTCGVDQDYMLTDSNGMTYISVSVHQGIKNDYFSSASDSALRSRGR